MTQDAQGYLHVNQAGPLAMLQDAGRFGVRHLGISQGGPMDIQAWAWANQLVGNAWGTTALEITLGGLTLQAEHDCWLCITGADLGARIDNQVAPLWHAFQLKKHQTLSFHWPIAGLRAYIAVRHGFQAAQILGSTACATRDRLGGHTGAGHLLTTGDQLAFNQAVQVQPSHNREPPPTLPALEQPDYQQTPLLNVIPGAQIQHFYGRSLFQFFNSTWRLDSRADRMGIRLQGDLLKCHMQSMISEGISLGAVQVPADGQPIVLMNDRQTIGGYPRLGTLTPLACSRLAQCKPSDAVRFKAIGLLQAQREYRCFLQRFR